MNKKILLQIILASVWIFSFAYFFASLFFYWANWEFFYYIKKTSKDLINKNIIVVEIDDLTYSKLWYPIQRSDYIPFLDNIKKSDPLVIWFDILFLDKWKDVKEDISFANKIKELWNIVLWFDIKNGNIAQMPYKPFYNWVLDVWYFQPFVDPITQKTFSVEPFKELVHDWKKSIFESFSFIIVKKYFELLYSKDYKVDTKIEDWNYNFVGKKVPLVNYNISWEVFKQFVINYSPPSLFKRESFYNIYTWNFNKEDFKDKIVLIWFTAEWVKDDFYLPSLWITKWVYIHANVINNLLNENFIIYFNKWVELAISFLFIFILMYLNISYLKTIDLKWITFWAVFLFIIIWALYFALFIFLYKFSWVYILPNFPFQFLAVLFLSFFVSSVLKYVNEDKNKRLLSKALSEYVSSDIAREILTSSWDVKLDWERKKISMFFSDIEGFTTISEKMSPENLVSFLKVYLWKMSDVIMDNRWFINKYEWDAIMALWGVFKTSDDFWVNDACRSALLQQKELWILNEDFVKVWFNKLNVRMWIHTWDAIIWNIWSEWRKMEFTALWDNVNLASRLEGINKYYHTNICASQSVFDVVWDKYVFRFLDKIKVKWKDVWINIYELVWFKDEVSDLKLKIIKDFENAISLYLARDFEKAKEIFVNLVALWDLPSKVYVERCELYSKTQVPEDWDGIFKFNEK